MITKELMLVPVFLLAAILIYRIYSVRREDAASSLQKIDREIEELKESIKNTKASLKEYHNKIVSKQDDLAYKATKGKLELFQNALAEKKELREIEDKKYKKELKWYT